MTVGPTATMASLPPVNATNSFLDSSPSAPTEDSVDSSMFIHHPRSEGPTHWRILGVVKMVRPHQWVKNVFVLAPIVFAKEVFAVDLLIRAAAAFAIFCMLAGSVYALNDLADVDADRLHPVKRFRPIASGRVPTRWVMPIVVGLIVSALGAATVLNLWFAAVGLLYFAQNVAYTKRLKHIAYVDVGCIALGFVLRVLAGGLATGIQISFYLVACTALLALFLGFGKRRHEFAAAERSGRQRIALESYSEKGLDLALTLTAVATVGTYLAYTLDAHTRAFFRSDWLWTSTIFVVLAVIRFLFIVRFRPKAESPTQAMLRDGTFVMIVMGWVMLVVWVVYHLRPAA
jgi:decaprenyl-phosphate phosphoribosyltransferase